VNGYSTYLLGSISNNGSAISYTYDANGNIETITQNGNQIKYYYDDLNKRLY
jgi:YD repeat-containing protein